MKYNIALIMLLLTTTVAQGKCVKAEGEYLTDGIGEQLTRLNLQKEKTFSLKHEAWSAGAHENKKVMNTKGTWSCAKGKLVLKIAKHVYNAIYVSIAENPYGVNEKTKVIYFKADVKNNLYYLNNKMFYPASIVKNITQGAQGY